MSFDAAVLVHLGCPREMGRGECETFLREFLGDEYVLGLPYFLRKFLARRIAKKRAGRFSETLKSCAENTGDFGLLPASLFHVKSLAQKLSARLGMDVFEAGVYGSENLAALRKKMDAQNLPGGKILFIPCYPQTASSTVFPAVREIERNFKGADFKIANSYARIPEYAQSVANSVLEKNEKFDAVVISFHSVPKPHLKLFDYEAECESSFFEIKKRLAGARVELAYQSAMKFGKWLEPNVFDLVKKLAEGGAKSIAVVCPGFFCDCIETLVEINADLRSEFLKCGGEKFSYINCLNSSDSQVKVFSEIVKREGFLQCPKL